MDKPRKAAPEPEAKPAVRPVDRFARALEWTERVMDLFGFFIFMLGGASLVLAFYDISQPPKDFSPALQPYVAALENVDQMSMVVAEVGVGVVLIVIGILMLFRTRVVQH